MRRMRVVGFVCEGIFLSPDVGWPLKGGGLAGSS